MPPKTLLRIVMLLSLTLLFSCEKDLPSDNLSLNEENPPFSPADYRNPDYGAWAYSIEEVKQYFEEKQVEVAGSTFEIGNDTLRQAMATAELLWDFADTVLYARSLEVLIVPVKISNLSQLPLGEEAYFVFFDEWGNLDSRLMLVSADDGYITQNASIYPDDFSGYIFQSAWKGVIDYSVRDDSGHITYKIRDSKLLDERDYDCYPGETVTISTGQAIAAAISAINFHVTYFTCFEFGGGWPGAFNNIDWFGLGNTNNQNTVGNSHNHGINPYYIGNYFNLGDFSGAEYQMAQAVNKFKEEYGLVYSGPSLWDMIQENCGDEFGQTGPNPLVFFHQLDGFLSAPYESMNSCLKDIVEESALRILALGYDLHLDRGQLLEVFSTDCIYGGNFEQCALTELRDWIGQWVEYTDAQRAWMESYPHITPGIVNYILNNQEDPELAQVLDTAFDFLEGQDWSPAALETVNSLLESGVEASVMQAIFEFIGSHHHPSADSNEKNLSIAVANAYASLYQELGPTILELGDVGNPEGLLWGIMKEMLLETVKELVADFIPGGTLATMGPELYDNLQGGDWMEAMYTAVDIILNEADAIFPAAKVASVALGMYVKGKHLKRAFEAFKKAKSLGEDFLLKLYNIFRNRLNWGVSQVRDKFQWLGGVNMKIDAASGNEFFEQLKEEFGATYAFPGKYGQPVYKILDVPVNQSLYIELYPDANSGWAWTIEISRGPQNANHFSDLNSQLKFRFDL